MNEKQILQIKKRFFLAAVVLLGILAVWKLNDISKTQLVNRTGQTFETGVVVRILEDNIQEDGTRVGQQTVVVRMTSGVKKGQELTTTSSAGYLFGAACRVGMRVVILQSVAGDSVITSVYSMDRKEVMIGFALLYLAALCIVGGQEGGSEEPGSCLYLWCDHLRLSAGRLFGLLAVLDFCMDLRDYCAGHHVSDRRGHKKDLMRHLGNTGRRHYRRGYSRHFFRAFRYHRMECVRY